MLNLYLIIICNPSIVNPGTVNNNLGSLSVYYQNVQGLIPFSSLSDKNPKFDETKMCELQNYIYASLPDVLIFNETWLKPSIDNSEIFPSHLYHTFRSDRSQNTHPCDCTNPKKFLLNGFAECGLIQCVKNATHNKGGILDVVLTSSVNFLSNLKVYDKNIVCNSDHYPITFDIKVKFKRIKVPKRQCYNYSKCGILTGDMP